MTKQAKPKQEHNGWGCVALVVGIFAVSFVVSKYQADTGKTLFGGSADTVPWIAGGGDVSDGAADFAEFASEPDYAATHGFTEGDQYVNDDPYQPDYGPPPEFSSGATNGAVNGYDFSWWDGVSDLDCRDFATHAEAQAFYKWQGGPAKDPHYLDGDSDGQACEGLP